MAADSRLIVEHSRVRVRCLQCAAVSEVESSSLLCGTCGGWRVEVLCGEELLLASVELERDDD
jgi:hydrogenase nickel incorporation protein HypA/HybF